MAPAEDLYNKNLSLVALGKERLDLRADRDPKAREKKSKLNPTRPQWATILTPGSNSEPRFIFVAQGLFWFPGHRPKIYPKLDLGPLGGQFSDQAQKLSFICESLP